MSYRINYGSSHKKKGSPAAQIRLPALTALCLLVFLFLVNCFWPEGSAYLNGIFDSSHTSASVMALDRFAEELYQGEPLAEAFSAFWDTIQP